MSWLSEPWLVLGLVGFISLLGFGPLKAWAFCSASALAFLSIVLYPEQSSEHFNSFLSFEMNPIRQFFALIVSSLGFLVGLYAHVYMENHSSARRFFGLLGLFQWSCLLVIFSNHSLLMATAWELTSFTSFLLIGFNLKDIEARKGAFQAFVVTGLGGLCLFGGLVLLSESAGTYRLNEIISSLSSFGSGPDTLVVILLLIAVITKSAQFPFHFWLPGAMRAPTPVSAYLHSATLVKLGLFFAALFWPILQLSTLWHVALSAIGLVSFAYGAFASIFYKDMKAGLAHTTFSQLGLILVCFAQRDPTIFYTGFLLTLAHALYKSCLFLSVGIVSKWTKTQDITKVSGLLKAWPPLAAIVGLSCFSMAGLPPSLGFLSKEYALEILFGNFQNQRAMIITWVCLLVGSLFTIVFAFLFFSQVFLGDSRRQAPSVQIKKMAKLLWPLPLAGLALGILTPLLALWWNFLGNQELVIAPPLSHGFTPILAISLSLILGGAFIAFALMKSKAYQNRAGWRRLQRVSLSRAFEFIFWNGLNTLGASASRAFDFLSEKRALLLTMIFSCLFLFPVLRGFEWPEARLFEEGYWQLTLILLASSFVALLAFFQKNAGVQIFLIGIVGYLIAYAFAILEAPDLVLTQVIVESASLIILVLAYKASKNAKERLRSTPKYNLLAWVVSFAMSVCLIVFFSYTSPLSKPKLASLYFFENAKALAGGNNLVNVILVDFRAIDTLGEITVLAIAFLSATAFTSLRLRRRLLPKPHPYVTEWMRRTGRLFYLALIVASLGFLLRGHYHPGGGFIGGLLAALALFIRMMLFGKPTHSLFLCGVGLVLAYVHALFPLLVGEGEFFESLPTIVGPSSLIFDVGVFLTVAGSIAGLMKLLLLYLSQSKIYWRPDNA